jgi:hypothetical protein
MRCNLFFERDLGEVILMRIKEGDGDQMRSDLYMVQYDDREFDCLQALGRYSGPRP